MQNLVFILIVVIYAVFYIVRLARKPREKESAPPPAAEPLFFEEEEPRPALMGRPPEYPDVRGASRLFMPEKKRDDAPLSSDSSAGGELPPRAQESRAPAPGKAQINAAPPLQRVENLRPLARAFVLSDIVGKPKGLSPGSGPAAEYHGSF
jgi:hypothetical protein